MQIKTWSINMTFGCFSGLKRRQIIIKAFQNETHSGMKVDLASCKHYLIGHWMRECDFVVISVILDQTKLV